MDFTEYNIKGFKSIFYPEIYKWELIDKVFKNLIKSYNYKEIKLQLIEKISLFKKTLGNDSDISKEMFSFTDKNGQLVTLIPEGTTSCVKEMILNGVIRNNSKIDVWYFTPVFRRENPQKGRNRLFYQIGLESFGVQESFKETEHIFLFKNLFSILKVNDIILEINCIDNSYNAIFKKFLFDFYLKYIDNFEIFKNSFKNPLSLLEKMYQKNLNIPCQLNFLNVKIKKDFLYFIYNIKKLGIFFVFNNYLVRGLNYYNGIIYEWTTILDNKKMAICSGGRYDNLSKLIGKYKSYSTGCALGVDRLCLKLNFKFNNFSENLILMSNEQPLHLNLKILSYINKTNNYCLLGFINSDKIKKYSKKYKNFLFANKSFIINKFIND